MGEATELALRVLAEKIGLLGYAARALDTLSKTERATYCNDHWQHDYKKVIVSLLTLPTPYSKAVYLTAGTPLVYPRHPMTHAFWRRVFFSFCLRDRLHRDL